jgi:glycosyltransferase 2 family protein
LAGGPKTWAILKGAATVATIVIAVKVLDWHALLAAVPAFSAGRLGLAAALSLAITAILAFRWAVLAAPAGDGPRIAAGGDALVAGVFGLITPGSVGGDAYRVVIAKDRRGGFSRAASLVLFERILGMASFCCLFLLAYAATAVRSQTAAVFDTAAVCIAALTGAIAVGLAAGPVLSCRLAACLGRSRVLWLATMAETLAVMPRSRLATTFALSLLSSAAWLAYVLVFASKVGLSVAALAMVTVVSEFSRLLPVSIQGVGVREATFAWLSSEAGGASGAAYVACAAAYALHFALVAGIGFAAYLVGRRAGAANGRSLPTGEAGRGN